MENTPQVVPSKSLRGVLTGVLDRVFHHRDQITVTRNGKAIAAIIHPDDLLLLNEVKRLGIASHEDLVSRKPWRQEP